MSASTIQIPALCIPRVFYRVTDRVLYGTFERLFGKGCIAELTMLPRQDRNTAEPYHLVFIRFNAYTAQHVLVPRAESVSPTLIVNDNGVVETADLVGDEIFDRITEFITQLEDDKEVRIEYRAPHYFKVSKYVQRKPRVKPVPRILPSSVKNNDVKDPFVRQRHQDEIEYVKLNAKKPKGQELVVIEEDDPESLEDV